MSKELVLDIGIGGGGSYIRRNTTQHERRIGIDNNARVLPALRRFYPEVTAVAASAEHLPFQSDTFSRIEIILPNTHLAVPGLENDHFALSPEYREEYAKSHPNGWYREFQRVLKPRGEMVIYGDIWVEPRQVEKTAKGLFTVEQESLLSMDVLAALGTRTVQTVMENITRMPYIPHINKQSKDLLVKMHLRSTKIRSQS